MKLVVGLGNPGSKYLMNRHNVGFMVLDALFSELAKVDIQANGEWDHSKNANADYTNFNLSEERIELLKPQTFMNKSGTAVSYAVRKHNITSDDIYVVYDDLDIPLGEYKIIKGKGPREHNGLLDIYEKLGTKDFWHIRVGVDNREKYNRIPGEKYVLMDFTKEEMVIVEGVIKEVTERLAEMLLEE